MPLIKGFGASQPYSRGKFQETLSERFRDLSGIFPEFLPESPSRTGGVAHSDREEREKREEKRSELVAGESVSHANLSGAVWRDSRHCSCDTPCTATLFMIYRVQS